jgi:hypothetical protein
MVETGPRLQPREIEEFERETGHRIPEDYKRFLLKANGGEPELKAFTFHRTNGREDEGAVWRFIGLNDGREQDLKYFVRVFLDGHRIPKDLFPIGNGGGGNLILMGASGRRAGHVYFWDHNWEAEEGDLPTDDNVYPVADSFESFLSSLRPLGE